MFPLHVTVFCSVVDPRLILFFFFLSRSDSKSKQKYYHGLVEYSQISNPGDGVLFSRLHLPYQMGRRRGCLHRALFIPILDF